MEGNTLVEVAEDRQVTYESIKLRFRNAVYRIIRQNNHDWEDVYHHKFNEDCGFTKN